MKQTWTKTVTVEREGGVVKRVTTSVCRDGHPMSEKEMDDFEKAMASEFEGEIAKIGESIARSFQGIAVSVREMFTRRPE